MLKNSIKKFVSASVLSTFVVASGVLTPATVLAAPHRIPPRPPIHRVHPHPPINHHFRIPPRPPIHRDHHRRVVVVNNNHRSKTETIVGIISILGGIVAANNARSVAEE